MSEERMNEVRAHVAELAAMDYPKVWVGEEGMTVEELLFQQEINDKLPEWLRVEPGEFVELEDTGVGVEIPDVSVDWIDGLYVLENLRDELPEEVYAGLYEEVLYIHAAKRGEVPVVCDSRERDVAGLPPVVRLVAVDELTPDDLRFVRLDMLEVFACGDTIMGPYVMEESERARAAVEGRLG